MSAKARYVRLMLENGDSNPNAYNFLAEVDILADGKNIAAGKKASAHSETAPSMTAAKANDGVYHKDAPDNCWSSTRGRR